MIAIPQQSSFTKFWFLTINGQHINKVQNATGSLTPKPKNGGKMIEVNFGNTCRFLEVPKNTKVWGLSPSGNKQLTVEFCKILRSESNAI